MAEQLAFDQGVADGSAIELQEFAVPTIGEVVQACSDQFLARAALAHYQDRLLQRCYLGNRLQGEHEGGRLANQAVGFLGTRHGRRDALPT